MTESEIEREVKRRLAVFNHAEEVTGNVSMTCRHYGSTRQTFNDWKKALRGARRGRSQTSF
jgi:hypothetical protein